MSHISEVFKRASIQSLREYLLRGISNDEINPMDYTEHLAKAHKAVNQLIEERFPNSEQHEAIKDRIYDYAGACEDVYMEIGLQCGFILAMEIVHNVRRK